MRSIPWITLVVGLWLLAAPFVVGYWDTFPATANDVALGVLIAAASLWMVLKADAPGWLDWALMIFGIWAVIAPFTLGYSARTIAMANDVAAGVIVIVLAIVRQVSTSRRLSHA
jgi:hypothetical protein